MMYVRMHVCMYVSEVGLCRNKYKYMYLPAWRVSGHYAISTPCALQLDTLSLQLYGYLNVCMYVYVCMYETECSLEGVSKTLLPPSESLRDSM